MIAVLAMPLMIGVGCGDEETAFDLATVFPANNEVSSWVEDADANDNGATGPEIAQTDPELEDLVNGHVAAAFRVRGFVSFGQEFYEQAGYQIIVYVWEMPDAATMDQLYTDLLGTDGAGFYEGTWTNISVAGASEGRELDNNTNWRFNVRKGEFLIETDNTTSQDDGTAKAQALQLIEAVVAKLP